MKALFVHDHKFVKIKNTYYSDGKFPAYVWERYLEHFDSLQVLARIDYESSITDIEKLDISSAENVEFDLVQNINSISTLLKRDKVLRNKIKNNIKKVDAVICRVPSTLSVIAIEECLSMGVPFAIEVVGDSWDAYWNYGNLQGKLYAPIIHNKTKKLVSKAPFVLYVTNEYLQKRYPSFGKKVACSNVELTNYDDKVLDRRLEKKDGKRIGLIGSLSITYKGIDTAIKAIANIKDEFPNLTFHVLGRGDPDKWRKLAIKYGVEDKVFFDGTLESGEAVYSWLDELDFYIHPSKQEGLPRAVIESMSRGLPIIASSIAGIPELLDMECLHTPGDINGLETLLRRRLNDKEWKKEQTIKNFNNAKEYTKENLTAKRTKFYKEFYNYVKLNINE